jgi:hypothetical protein
MNSPDFIHRKPETNDQGRPDNASSMFHALPDNVWARPVGWPLSADKLAAMTEGFLLAAIRAEQAEAAARNAMAERAARQPIQRAYKRPVTLKSHVHPRVTVDGVSRNFNKVRDAFAAHGLPDNKHQGVRSQLKADGRVVFIHNAKSYVFEVRQ